MTIHVATKNSPNVTEANFEEKVKAIALLLDEKCPFPSLFMLAHKIVQM